jgi:hypothetical protein
MCTDAVAECTIRLKGLSDFQTEDCHSRRERAFLSGGQPPSPTFTYESEKSRTEPYQWTGQELDVEPALRYDRVGQWVDPAQGRVLDEDVH